MLSKGDIKEKIEILVVTKYLNSYSIDVLCRIGLTAAVRRINLPGIWLDSVTKMSPVVALNIDTPISQNTVDAKLALLEYYVQQYPKIISEINFGFSLKSIIEQDFKAISNEIETIHEYLTITNNSRFFLDLRFVENDDELLRICDLIEQNGGVSVVIGSLDKKINPLDIPLAAHRITKHTNLNVSVFGNFKDLGTLEELNKMPFKSILVLPSLIFNEFEKNSV